MRTTLNLDEALLADFRQLAASGHRSLSSVIQDALREALAARAERGVRAPLDLPVFRGGGGARTSRITGAIVSGSSEPSPPTSPWRSRGP